MLSSLAPREKLFRKFKAGDPGALTELLEAERGELYDYLMRMTGQISRSAETIDEVYVTLTDETLDTLETIDNYNDLRHCLYTTARKFNADIWNAATPKLMNAALAEPPADKPLGKRAALERQAFVGLEKVVRHLPGPEREAVLLRFRFGFTVAECAELMFLTADEVDQRAAAASGRIDTESGATATLGGAEQSLLRLPLHPLPQRTAEGTVNLSMVMHGIKAKPRGVFGVLPRRLLWLAAIVAAALAALSILKPDLGRQVRQLIGVTN